MGSKCVVVVAAVETQNVVAAADQSGAPTRNHRRPEVVASGDHRLLCTMQPTRNNRSDQGRNSCPDRHQPNTSIGTFFGFFFLTQIVSNVFLFVNSTPSPHRTPPPQRQGVIQRHNTGSKPPSPAASNRHHIMPQHHCSPLGKSSICLN